MSVLDHVTLTVPDVALAGRFYDAVLAPLGLVRLDELVDEEEDDAAVEVAAWGPPGGGAVLWAVAGAVPTTGLHVCLHAPDPDAVTAVADAAVRHGGRVKDAPRRWALYRRGRFGAMVVDPWGTVVEAVAEER